MQVCILMGSFRKKGNTATLLQPFIKELEKLGASIEYITLCDMHLEPCTACWTCQDIFDKPGCPKQDDMHVVFDAVIKADCIVFATPVYSWYCTPPMKAVLDRLVFAMNKYYGEKEGPCLWEGKPCALITTCGYEIEAGAGVLEEGLRRYSKHSRLNYLGKLAVRDIKGISYFKNETAVAAAEEFARKVHNAL